MSDHYARTKLWRHQHPELWLAMKRRNYAQTQDATNSTLSWIPAEDRALLGWDGTDRELSALLGRSVRAIQVRRSRLRSSDQRRNAA